MKDFLRFEDIRLMIDRIVTLEEEQQVIYCHINKILDEFANLHREVSSNFKDFIDYAEKSPKADEQWAEVRLRALEDKVARLEMQQELKHD